MKKVISLSLDEGLLATIDQQRGDVSRSRFVENRLVGQIAYAPDYDSRPSDSIAVRSQDPEPLVGTEGSGAVPDRCPRHPGAGRMRNGKKTFCDAPLCQFEYK